MYRPVILFSMLATCAVASPTILDGYGYPVDHESAPLPSWYNELPTADITDLGELYQLSQRIQSRPFLEPEAPHPWQKSDAMVNVLLDRLAAMEEELANLADRPRYATHGPEAIGSKKTVKVVKLPERARRSNRRISKRNPKCMMRCLQAKILHPAQCHVLC